MTRSVQYALAILITLAVPIGATPPNPIVASLFVPIEGEVIEPGTTNILHLTGEVHVVTHFAVSEEGIVSLGVWANLVRVRGTSQITGNTYLAVGAGNVGWNGVSPGPPEIPEQQLDFALVNIGVNPGPPEVPPSPIIPVFFRNFTFGAENTNYGKLQSVDASFEN